MISFNLKFFLGIVTTLYIIIILIAIKRQSMPIKSSIIWLSFGIAMIICIFIQPFLSKICKIIGIKEVSNLLLFGGFMGLLILSFDLYSLYYKLKKKNIVLAQELAILKNEFKNK